MFVLVSSLVIGLVAGLVNGLVAGLVSGLIAGFGVGVGLMGGLGIGLASSQIWATTVAWLQLRRSRQVPAISLIPLLEDARERGILRAVGAFYQFRHATLQDQLSAAQRPS